MDSDQLPYYHKLMTRKQSGFSFFNTHEFGHLDAIALRKSVHFAWMVTRGRNDSREHEKAENYIPKLLLHVQMLGKGCGLSKVATRLWWEVLNWFGRQRTMSDTMKNALR